jgi:hypothetical protein
MKPRGRGSRISMSGSQLINFMGSAKHTDKRGGGELMQSIEIHCGREQKSLCGLGDIITREEYGALMSGLANLESELENLPKILAAEKQVKKLQYFLLVQLGLLIAVFLLCRNG